MMEREQDVFDRVIDDRRQSLASTAVSYQLHLHLCQDSARYTMTAIHTPCSCYTTDAIPIEIHCS